MSLDKTAPVIDPRSALCPMHGLRLFRIETSPNGEDTFICDECYRKNIMRGRNN